MKQVLIPEATEVVNINDARESWSVQESFTCRNGTVAAILVNNDEKAFHGKQCDHVESLKEKGYRGYK